MVFGTNFVPHLVQMIDKIGHKNGGNMQRFSLFGIDLVNDLSDRFRNGFKGFVVTFILGFQTNRDDFLPTLPTHTCVERNKKNNPIDYASDNNPAFQCHYLPGFG